MMKHTEGPWMLAPAGHYTHRKDISNIGPKGGFAVVQVERGGETKEANALLISSAPEIATALEAAWYGMVKHNPNECSREIAMAEKLLRRLGSLPNTNMRLEERSAAE